MWEERFESRARTSFLAVILLGAFGAPAYAQVYLQSEAPGTFVPIANLPGITGLTPVVFSDDDEGTADIPIPFAYSYVGRPFTEVTIGVNGLMVFGNGPFGGYINDPIGSASSPNDMIAVWWDDLILGDITGFADYGILGTAPSRILVIEVRDLERYPYASRNDFSWQVWLYEGPEGRFDVQYSGELTPAESYSATVGWEGPGGNGVPFGAFRPCGLASPYCNNVHFATMAGVVFTVRRAQGPDLTGTVGTFPRGAFPGQSVVGTVSLQNVGTVDAANVSSRILLSTDPIVSANDVEVATFVTPLLAAGGAPTQVQVTVTPPLGAPAANYYLLLQIDDPNAVTEPDETNNAAVAAARFATAYELTPVEVFAPGQANPGETLDIDVELDNVGIPYVGPVSLELRASLDRVFDAQDPLLGTFTIMLDGSPNDLQIVQVILPAIQPGSYYPIVRVDPLNAITEYDELNTRVGTVTFGSGPDLRPVAAVVPPGALPGQSFGVMLSIANQGAPLTGAVQVRVHASLDPIFDVNDPVLGTFTVNLNGQASQTFPLAITMPQIGAADWYPIFRVDPANQFREISEFNNTLIGLTTFASAPDFMAIDIVVPAVGTPGVTAPFTTQLVSRGAPYTGVLVYRLYVSRDQIYDAQDALLGSFAVAWAGEPSLADARTPTFPNVVPGDYYVIAVLDPGNALAESDERNNQYVDATRLQSGSDFRPESIAFSPATVRAGDTVTVTFDIRTSVSPYTGQLPYQIWFSTDSTLDARDTLVYEATASLTGQTITSLTAPVVIGVLGPVPPAQYRVFVSVDPDDLIPERSETNNADDGFGTVRVEGPNLSVTSVESAPLGFIGRPLRIDLTIANSAPVDAAAFRYAYYLTANGIVRQGERIFESSPMTLAANGTATLTDEVVLLGTALPGTYQLGVIIDFEEAVSESNEADNLVIAPQSVRVLNLVPDLVGRLTSTPTAAAAGESLAVSRVIENVGVAPAVGFDYAYYLSADATVTATDIRLGTFTSSLAESGFEHAIDVVEVPSALAPGNYYLGLVLDPQNRTPEVVETNNVYVGPLIPVYPAAIVVLTSTVPDARLGVPYEVGLYARGGALGQRWSINGGALPPGLVLDAITGIVSGTPSLDGAFTFVARATSGPAFADRELLLSVRAPTVPLALIPVALPAGLVGHPFRASLSAVGGEVPYRFGSGSRMPDGLTLSPDGVISGVPESVGSDRLDVEVVDRLGARATAVVVLRVLDPSQTVRITQTPLPDAIAGVPYCSLNEPIRLFASGGVPPYRWSLGGPVPTGLTLSATGELCGTLSQMGDHDFVVRVVDDAGLSDTSLFVVRVVASNAIAVRTTALADALIGAAYSAQLEVSLGQSPFAWSLEQGSLPPGVQLGGDGLLDGAPTELGTFTFAVRVTDAARATRLQPLSIRVVEATEVGSGGGCGCASTPVRAEGPPSLWVLGLGAFLALRGRRPKRDRLRRKS